ncbi:hypothetical protein F8M41_025066 [Gigaspora margarita]|uniref:Uncharacterized protein n=1 Tax=Gigaspora margarita TaxID=4874 RepID=A0A8H4B0D4_GIGMA|nr:hypothetical protein F8M41_025066 [Gigaspora margarita]
MSTNHKDLALIDSTSKILLAKLLKSLLPEIDNNNGIPEEPTHNVGFGFEKKSSIWNCSFDKKRPVQYREAAKIKNTDEILSLGPWYENKGELEKDEEKKFRVEANKYKGVEFKRKLL